METHSPSFGDWLDDQLRERRWTQTEFAVMLGTSQSTISGWINGAARPRRRACRQIADALQVPTDDVLSLAGYAPIDSAGPKGRQMLEENLSDGWDVIEEVGDSDRMYASVVEGLQHLDLHPDDLAAIQRMLALARTEAARRRQEPRDT